MANSFKKLAQKAPGAVDHTANPFAKGIRSSSPSVNFIFGNTHLFPEGAVAIATGLMKSGKSLLANDMIAQLHKDDPTACALKWNTEGRESFQMTPTQLESWGIDLDRYQAYDTRDPKAIFDTIETMIPEMIENGDNIKLVVIDSITNIRGLMSLDAGSVEDQFRADNARTVQAGLDRVVDMLRRHKICLLLTAQQRAEQDANKAKYTPTKMAGGFYLLHTAEYIINIARDNDSDNKKDLEGNKLEGALKDLHDVSDTTGHKIRFKMTGNSCGPAGRTGLVTVDYAKGFINQHEEVFMLAINRRIFSRPNNRTYTYKDKKWSSYAEALQAVKNSPDLQAEIIKELRRQDIEKDFSRIPATDLELSDLDKQAALE